MSILRVKKKRVVIYVRVSTTRQAEEGYSLEQQEKILRQYARMRGYQVVAVYKDAGRSGKNMEKRPGITQLLEAADNKEFDLVLVWKITRFARNLFDLVTACKRMSDKGIYLVSYSESFDASTPVGRMIMSILGIIAQWEIEVMSENAKMAAEARAMKGMRTCSYILGYDVTRKEKGMKVNKKEAEIVRFIFEEYIRSKSITRVMEACHAKGYKGKRGSDFNTWSIESILLRFTYCGYYSFREEPIKGNFKPIIDVKTFNKAQRILRRQGKKTGRNRKHKIKLLPEEAE